MKFRILSVEHYFFYDVEGFANVDVKFSECKEIFNFTIDYETMEWGTCPRDNRTTTERYANLLGIRLIDFWDVIEPELNKIFEESRQ